MKQKVWVLGDEYSSADQPTVALQSAGPSLLEKRGAATSTADKNPAVSFSLSMLVWGGGYMYLGHYLLGAFLMVFQLFFAAALTCVFLYWDSVRSLAMEYPFETPLFVLASLAVMQVAFILWLGGAVDAYRRTVKFMTDVDTGVERNFLPLFANLVFPGWGQLLNGQPKKGTVYLLFSLMGLSSVFVLLSVRPVWPLVALSTNHEVFELVIVAALVFIPLALLAWIVSVYDVFRSRIGDKLYTWMPRFSAVLLLLLAVSVAMQLIPDQYYPKLLESGRQEMLKNNMTLIPDLAQNIYDLLSRLMTKTFWL